jgi:hypothetical protein
MVFRKLIFGRFILVFIIIATLGLKLNNITMLGTILHCNHRVMIKYCHNYARYCINCATFQTEK